VSYKLIPKEGKVYKTAACRISCSPLYAS